LDGLHSGILVGCELGCRKEGDRDTGCLDVGAVVGERDGDAKDGAAVGEKDGFIEDGATVGARDGEIEVGTAVEKDGVIEDGAEVGKRDGEVEDGAAVGETDDDAKDDAIDEENVGEIDGATVTE